MLVSKQEIIELRQAIGNCAQSYDDLALAALWIWFSDEVYSAGFISARPDTVKEFKIWLKEKQVMLKED